MYISGVEKLKTPLGSEAVLRLESENARLREEIEVSLAKRDLSSAISLTRLRLAAMYVVNTLYKSGFPAAPLKKLGEN